MSRARLGLAALALVLGAACADRASGPPASFADASPRGLPAESYRLGAHTPAPGATATIYLPGAVRPRPIRYQIQGGMAVYQGDMMLGPAHLVPVLYALPRAPADGREYATASSKAHRWPNNELPYDIDPSVSAEKRDWIAWAAAHYAAVTPLRLRPKAPGDANYLLFTADGEGCSSYVGRVGGPQPVQIAGCGVRGSVVHEIGHAAGLYHEQSRKDRDGYVAIVWSEIAPGEEAQFTVDDDTMDIGPYDYGSIMHYSRAAFSRSGADTIVPRDPNARIGQREGLSQLDQAAIAQLYSGAVTPTLPSVAPTQGGVLQIPGLPPIPVPAMTAIPGMPPGLPQIPGLPTLGPAPTPGQPPAPATPFGLPAIPGLPTALPPIPVPSGLPPIPGLTPPSGT